MQRHVDALLGHVAIELGQKDPREGAVVEQLGAMLGQAESILGPGQAGALWGGNCLLEKLRALLRQCM